MNKVKISGVLLDDTKICYTPSGQAFVNFKLLVKDENSKTSKNFIPVIAIGKIVEKSRQYFKKGNNISVEGKLKYREYNTVEGEHRVVLEILAEKIKPTR